MKKQLVPILSWILVLGGGAAGAQDSGDKPRILGREKLTLQDVHFLDEEGQVQRGTRCATPTPSAAEKARVRAEVEALAPHVFLKSAIVVPVAFHVVHKGSQGNVPASQIDDQIAVLNAAYAGTGFSFYLASVDYTDNGRWFDRCGSIGWEKKMKQALAIDVPHTLNYYTCNPSLLGWAYMPWTYSEDSFWHGVVLNYGTLPGGSAAPYTLGHLGAHEVGHYLGLHHTFEGGGCSGAGDEVADTPPEASAATGCPVGRDTCVGDGPDPIHNYMDYSDDACTNELTPGQDSRMQAITATYRPNLGN